MPLYTPRKVVLNWYRYDVSESIALVESFVVGVEEQAEKLLVQYYEQKQTHIYENTEEGSARIVEVHQGLNDETWDLEGIFGKYFPNLQRRSALLTVCGFFEYQLDNLCLLYQSEKGYKLTLSDLNGKGIDRSTNYLEKVAGLEVFKESKIWNNIKNIQKIRNIIVHQDGKLKNATQQTLDYINQMEFLEGGDEVTIKRGFLSYVVSDHKEYCGLLGGSIKKKETV
jgi:hypothetical protein